MGFMPWCESDKVSIRVVSLFMTRSGLLWKENVKERTVRDLVAQCVKAVVLSVG